MKTKFIFVLFTTNLYESVCAFCNHFAWWTFFRLQLQKLILIVDYLVNIMHIFVFISGSFSHKIHIYEAWSPYGYADDWPIGVYHERLYCIRGNFEIFPRVATQYYAAFWHAVCIATAMQIESHTHHIWRAVRRCACVDASPADACRWMLLCIPYTWTAAPLCAISRVNSEIKWNMENVIKITQFRSVVDGLFCFTKCVRCVKCRGHWLHEYGLILLWTLVCAMHWDFRRNSRPHTSHLNGFSPVWTRLCSVRLIACTNDLSPAMKTETNTIYRKSSEFSIC